MKNNSKVVDPKNQKFNTKKSFTYLAKSEVVNREKL